MAPLPKNSDQDPAANIQVSRNNNIDGDFINDLMKIKRARAAAYHQSRPLFMSIGFMVSMGIVVLAFEWKTYNGGTMVDVNSSTVATEELIDIPPTEQAPPPPPKPLQQPNFTEVEEEEIVDEIEVTFDVEITENSKIEPTEINLEMEAPEEEVADEIFTIVEDQPTPKGGYDAFMQYLYSNIRYPSSASRLGIQGKVFVQFVVSKDGTITEPVVIKGIGGGCDEEAVRVIANSPKWNPGKQRGNPVRVRLVLPVNFVLRDKG